MVKIGEILCRGLSCGFILGLFILGLHIDLSSYKTGMEGPNVFAHIRYAESASNIVNVSHGKR